MYEHHLTADPQSLSALTAVFVRGSERYRDVSPDGRAIADAAVSSVTAGLFDLASPRKSQTVAAYKTDIQSLLLGGWLTPSQAGVLIIFSDAI